MRAFLTFACVGSGVLGVVTWFFPKLLFATPAAAANNAGSLGGWVNAGGNASTLMGLGALAAAPSIAPKEKPGPCDSYRKEVARGARLLADKEKELADLKAEYEMYLPLIAQRQHYKVLEMLRETGVLPIWVPPPPTLPGWREARMSVLPNFIHNAELALPGHRRRQAEREKALANCMSRQGATSPAGDTTSRVETPVPDPQPRPNRSGGGGGGLSRAGAGAGGSRGPVEQLIERAPTPRTSAAPVPGAQVPRAPAVAWVGGPPVLTVPTKDGPVYIDPTGNRVIPAVLDHLGRPIVRGLPIASWPPSSPPRPYWEGGPPVYGIAHPLPNDDVEWVYVDANGNEILPVPGAHYIPTGPDLVVDGTRTAYVPYAGTPPAPVTKRGRATASASTSRIPTARTHGTAGRQRATCTYRTAGRQRDTSTDDAADHQADTEHAPAAPPVADAAAPAPTPSGAPPTSAPAPAAPRRAARAAGPRRRLGPIGWGRPPRRRAVSRPMSLRPWRGSKMRAERWTT